MEGLWRQSCLKVVFKLSPSCFQVVSKFSLGCLQVVSKLSPSCPQIFSKLSRSCFLVVSSGWGAVVGYGVMVVWGRPQGCLKVVSKLSPCWPKLSPGGWGAVVGFEGGSLRAGLWPRAGSSDHATLNIPSSWVLCSANLPIPSCPPWVVSTIPSLRYSALLPYSPHSCIPFNYSDLLLPTW